MGKSAFTEEMDRILPKVIDLVAEHMEISGEDEDSYILYSSPVLRELIDSDRTGEEKVIWGYWVGVLTALMKWGEDPMTALGMIETLHDEIRRRKNESTTGA